MNPSMEFAIEHVVRRSASFSSSRFPPVGFQHFLVIELLGLEMVLGNDAPDSIDCPIG